MIGELLVLVENDEILVCRSARLVRIELSWENLPTGPLVLVAGSRDLPPTVTGIESAQTIVLGGLGIGGQPYSPT